MLVWQDKLNGLLSFWQLIHANGPFFKQNSSNRPESRKLSIKLFRCKFETFWDSLAAEKWKFANSTFLIFCLASEIRQNSTKLEKFWLFQWFLRFWWFWCSDSSVCSVISMFLMVQIFCWWSWWFCSLGWYWQMQWLWWFYWIGCPDGSLVSDDSVSSHFSVSMVLTFQSTLPFPVLLQNVTFNTYLHINS